MRPRYTGDSRKLVPVHVHVVTAEVERYKELEDKRILWIRRREITQQAACGRPVVILKDPDRQNRQSQNPRPEGRKVDTPISDHIEHGAEL